ncbi:MAG: nucleotidyltransferase domain-containing protein, partial [Myxococcota bacterium]
ELKRLGLAEWDHRRLRGEVIYSAVVGSRAWGLDSPQSDEDVRGCFLAPFEDWIGLWRVPDEIHDAHHGEALWEVSKLIFQGLRGDANTLETLWSPLHRVVTPLGQTLIDRREIFSSMNVLGSFGRYAQSQFRKIERSLARDQALRVLLTEAEAGRVRDEVTALKTLSTSLALSDAQTRAELKAILRSLVDRGVLVGGLSEFLAAVAAGRSPDFDPAPYRPKNAYNLLRLLHSCVHWLQHGEPMIEVPTPLRGVLLDVKEQRSPIEDTLRRAREVAEQVEEVAAEAKLPLAPNYGAADELLRDLRRAAARARLAPEVSTPARPGPRAEEDLFAVRRFPAPLPPDVAVDTLGRFLDASLPAGPPVIALVLSGAHAYGFPSPDSDLDLKGTHVEGAERLLRIGAGPATHDRLEVFEGREHDYTTNDLGPSMKLLLNGNGNLIERFLGPYPLVETAAGRRLSELAQGSLSRRCHHHYRGFMKGVLREYEREKGSGHRKAKRLLYAFRVALTGLHLLREGVLVTNARTLAPAYGYADEVEALFEVKVRAEGAEIDEDAGYLSSLDRLEGELEAAVPKSSLPPEPTNVEAVQSFVVELRQVFSKAGPFASRPFV